MTVNRGRRRRKSSIDTERIRIIFCRYCRAKITFSYNSVGCDGKPFPCNLDGTRHVDEIEGGKA